MKCRLGHGKFEGPSYENRGIKINNNNINNIN
jgi:hypothetical protein